MSTTCPSFPTLLHPDVFQAAEKARPDWPGWLQRLKSDAIERCLTLPLPHAKVESWRFAQLNWLGLENLRPSVLTANAANTAYAPERIASIHAAAQIDFIDDQPRQVDPLPQALRESGVIFLPLAEAISQYPGLVQEHLFSRLPDLGSKKFESLHAALFQNGTFLYVPRGVIVEMPFIANHWLGAAADVAIFPHTLLVADEQSKVTLIDVFRSVQPSTRGFACGVADIYAGFGARVKYKAVQNWNLQTAGFHLGAATAERDATLQTIMVHVGGSHIRNEQHCRILGPGAHVEMDSLSVVKGSQEVDQRTLQTHSAPQGHSNLLYKNVLLDTARTIFAGLIRVEPNAQKTDAYQSNRNLLLSDEADANSLPGLEIQANDVRCTHGATTSQIDEEALFYLLARGIPRRKAQELLTFGFCEEVIEKIENPEIREYVRQLVQHKFAE